MKLFLVEWEESERGWGIRPDGYSIHVNEAAAEAFIKAYWERQPDEVPDEYERPALGTSGKAGREIEVADDSSLAQWLGDKQSVRIQQHEKDLIVAIRAAQKTARGY